MSSYTIQGPSPSLCDALLGTCQVPGESVVSRADEIQKLTRNIFVYGIGITA